MAIDQVLIGKRFKEARLNCGMTQEEVAEFLAIPRTALVNIESGERSVSTLELTKLARLYRRSIGELLSEAAEDEDIFVVLHRIDQEFSADPAVKKEVAEHVAICREGNDLKELLGITSEDAPPEYHLSSPQSIMQSVEQGNSVAIKERRRLGLGDLPLPDFAKLIAEQGIWAAKALLPNEMSGIFLHHASFGLAILINEDHPRPRRRFSFAHEYAHALMDRLASATITSNKNRTDLVEVRANAFAAAFLLPVDGVRSFLHHRKKVLPSREEQIVYDPSVTDAATLVTALARHQASFSKVTYQDVASLKYFFGTSYQAACYRLKSLNLVNKQELDDLIEKEELAKEVFALLALRDEPSDEDVLLLQVVNLAVEAYRREVLSQGRLRDISSVLGIKASELLKLAEAA